VSELSVSSKHNSNKNLLQINAMPVVEAMGVGRIFCGGEATKRFFQNISRGGQKWQNLFFPTRN